MKKNIFFILATLSLLFMGCNSSSDEKQSNTLSKNEKRGLVTPPSIPTYTKEKR